MIEVNCLDNFKKKVCYKIGEEIVGYVLLEETIDIINIIDVLVEEKHRREGIGKKLLKYIIDLYKNKNVKLMLEVREDNMPAIKLYESTGFKVIFKREKYYKDCDALIMEMIL